jgi:hypothetical protein
MAIATVNARNTPSATNRFMGSTPFLLSMLKGMAIFAPACWPCQGIPPVLSPWYREALIACVTQEMVAI